MNTQSNAVPLVIGLAAGLAATASGQIQLNLNGGTLVHAAAPQDLQIPDLPGERLTLTVRGADGGDANFSNCDRVGGEGATASLLVEIGDGPNQLQPGGYLRFLVGDEGESASGGSAAGGGGGSGVLYRASSDDEWIPVAVAGGGGGAVSLGFIFCGDRADGKDANVEPEGTSGGGNKGGAGGSDGNGGRAEIVLGSAIHSGGGGGLWSDAWYEWDYTPAGRGYDSGGSGETFNHSHDGGWGCGGGGGGGSGGGGGGGYSGGGGGSSGGEGGGGGSWIDPGFAITSSITVGNNGGDGSATYTWERPTNDDPSGAIELTDGVVVRGTTSVGATGTPVLCGAASPTDDVWYVVSNSTACPQDLTVEATDGIVMLDGFSIPFDPGGCRGASLLGTYVDSLAPGESILLRVTSPSLDFELSTTLESGGLTAGDCHPNAVGAVDLGIVGEPGRVIAQTGGSDFDTEIGIFDTHGTLLASNDDYRDELQSYVSMTLDDGIYFLVASGHPNSASSGFNVGSAPSAGGTLRGRVGSANFNSSVGSGESVFYRFEIRTPLPTPCNASDVASPFEVLNAADVNTFINAFLANGERADLTEPFGMLNAADVNTFVNAFLAGCP